MAHQEKLHSLVQSLREVAQSSDEAHNATVDALRGFLSSIQTKDDVYNRIEQSNIELPITRIAEDLDLFQILAENERPLTVDELAAKVGVAPLLLSRLLRFLSSIGHIKETDVNTFTGNNTTKILATDAYKGLVYHTFDNVGPIIAELPDFLAETKYQDITSGTNCPAQKAFNTPLHMFQWIPSQPKRLGPMQQTMMIQPRGEPWFTVYPFKEEVNSFSGETVFVDLGGGFGHQSAALLEAHPDLGGKIIVQDLKETLEAAPPPPPGIKSVAHDFFTEQPVKAAKFYYIRQILHDWPDDKSIKILQRIKDAMGAESRLLIDEAVVPNSGAHQQATTIDMVMLSCLAAIERTESEWHELLSTAGFKILGIHTYNARRKNSIIEAVPL